MVQYPAATLVSFALRWWTCKSPRILLCSYCTGFIFECGYPRDESDGDSAHSDHLTQRLLILDHWGSQKQPCNPLQNQPMVPTHKSAQCGLTSIEEALSAWNRSCNAKKNHEKYMTSDGSSCGLSGGEERPEDSGLYNLCSLRRLCLWLVTFVLYYRRSATSTTLLVHLERAHLQVQRPSNEERPRRAPLYLHHAAAAARA